MTRRPAPRPPGFRLGRRFLVLSSHQAWTRSVRPTKKIEMIYLIATNCRASGGAISGISGFPWGFRMGRTHGQMSVFGDGLGAGTDVKLLVYAADVGIDGLDADLEHLGDFLVKVAAGEEFEDFAFARG